MKIEREILRDSKLRFDYVRQFLDLNYFNYYSQLFVKRHGKFYKWFFYYIFL